MRNVIVADLMSQTIQRDESAIRPAHSFYIRKGDTMKPKKDVRLYFTGGVCFLLMLFYACGSEASEQPTRIYNSKEELEKAANEGDATASIMLGMMYLEGLGEEADQEKAFALFSASAARGDPYAQYLVGICYEWGYGVDKDADKAKEWVAKAEGKNAYGVYNFIQSANSQKIRYSSQYFTTSFWEPAAPMEIHKDKTIDWAKEIGFTELQANIIGEASASVDGRNSFFRVVNGIWWAIANSGKDAHCHYMIRNDGDKLVGREKAKMLMKLKFTECCSLLVRPRNDMNAYKEFGQGLHTFQDRFTHNDENDLPMRDNEHPIGISVIREVGPDFDPVKMTRVEEETKIILKKLYNHIE